MTKSILYIFLSFILVSCGKIQKPEEVVVQVAKNKGHKLIMQMAEKVGDYEELSKKNDVTYTYTYQTPDGKTDISTEKYIFDGELSYGHYKKHDRTFSDLEGDIEQGYDGQQYWLKNNGSLLDDDKRLKRVAFNRPTNFYWFTMFQKLLDPGLNYDYLGEKIIDDKKYDIVKVSFTDEKKPTDIYQVYINRETALIDQFLFTVADFGIMDDPKLMQVSYEEIDGILIPTTRKYKNSTWNADVNDDPWIFVNWSDIRFNNNLSKKDFQK